MLLTQIHRFRKERSVGGRQKKALKDKMREVVVLMEVRKWLIAMRMREIDDQENSDIDGDNHCITKESGDNGDDDDDDDDDDGTNEHGDDVDYHLDDGNDGDDEDDDTNEHSDHDDHLDDGNDGKDDDDDTNEHGDDVDDHLDDGNDAMMMVMTLLSMVIMLNDHLDDGNDGDDHNDDDTNEHG
eukprot:Em0088g14a